MPWKIAALAGVLLAAAAGLLVFTMRDGSAASQQTPAPQVAEIPGKGPFLALLDTPAAAPNDVFLNGDGTEARLEDFKGKVVVLNFWATWCAPCVKELPSLVRLQQARGDLTVIALNVDTKLEGPIGDFLKEVGAAELEAYADPPAIS